MDQRSNLFLHRFDHRLRAVAQKVAAPAGKQVEVGGSLRIPHPRALTLHKTDGEPTVVGHHVAVEGVDHRLRCQANTRRCVCGSGVS